MEQTPPPALTGLLGGFAGLAVMATFPWLFARIGGWRSLAARYPASGPARGERFGLQSLWLSLPGEYLNCVNVTVGPEGLHLVPFLLFRLGHPAVLIPWSAIRSVERRGRWLVRTHITLHDGKHFALAGRAEEALLSHWPASRGML